MQVVVRAGRPVAMSEPGYWERLDLQRALRRAGFLCAMPLGFALLLLYARQRVWHPGLMAVVLICAGLLLLLKGTEELTLRQQPKTRLGRFLPYNLQRAETSAFVITQIAVVLFLLEFRLALLAAGLNFGIGGDLSYVALLFLLPARALAARRQRNSRSTDVLEAVLRTCILTVAFLLPAFTITATVIPSDSPLTRPAPPGIAAVWLIVILVVLTVWSMLAGRIHQAHGRSPLPPQDRPAGGRKLQY